VVRASVQQLLIDTLSGGATTDQLKLLKTWLAGLPIKYKTEDIFYKQALTISFALIVAIGR